MKLLKLSMWLSLVIFLFSCNNVIENEEINQSSDLKLIAEDSENGDLKLVIPENEIQKLLVDKEETSIEIVEESYLLSTENDCFSYIVTKYSQEGKLILKAIPIVANVNNKWFLGKDVEKLLANNESRKSEFKCLEDTNLLKSGAAGHTHTCTSQTTDPCNCCDFIYVDVTDTLSQIVGCKCSTFDGCSGLNGGCKHSRSNKK